jgi:hypothetical protein
MSSNSRIAMKRWAFSRFIMFSPAIIVVLQGCVILPDNDTRMIAELAPHIPAEWASDNHPFLVLTQSSLRQRRTFFTFSTSEFNTWNTSSVVTADFINGSDLPALNKTLSQFEQRGVWMLFCGGYSCGSGSVRNSERQLTRLCAIAPDGREIGLSPLDGGWDVQPPRSIHTARRDAIQAALSAGNTRPFDQLDGPCGIFGEIEWAPELKPRIQYFFSAMPERIPDAPSSKFEEIANGLRASGGEDRQGLLIGVARWRDQLAWTPPLSLNKKDFAELEKIASNSRHEDFVAFFPDHLKAYVSGTRALDSFAIESFCAIQVDGAGFFWSKTARAWKKLDPVPPLVGWKKEISDRISGAADSQVFAESCLGSTPASWTPPEVAQAVSFINALPSSPESHPAAGVLAAMLRPIAQADTSSSAALVIVSNTGKVGAGERRQLGLFLATPLQTATSLDRVLASIAPDELPRALQIEGEALTADRFCILTVSGEVSSRSRNPGLNIWNSQSGSTLDSKLRASALGSFSASRFGDGLPICGVESAEWPDDDSRLRVRSFLGRITP